MMLKGMYDYLVAHPKVFLVILAAISQLATTIQLAVPEDDMPHWLTGLLGWVGSVAPPSKRGLLGDFSIPYLHIPMKDKPLMLDDPDPVTVELKLKKEHPNV